VKRVFGDPIEKDGVTIIPVARVMGGAGAGGGEEDAEKMTGAASTESGAPGAAAVGAASFGMGFGVMSSPAGVYVIKGDKVRWEPAVNVERLVATGGIVAVLILLASRSILRILLKR